jgi:hypothetical protein
VEERPGRAGTRATDEREETRAINIACSALESGIIACQAEPDLLQVNEAFRAKPGLPCYFATRFDDVQGE